MNRSTVPPHLTLERLQPVLDTALDAVVAMRRDGTVAGWNHVAERTFGWAREDALGRMMGELIVPPQHRQAHAEGLDRYNRTGHGPVLGKILEITAIHRDGREFPIELSITVAGTGEETIFVGFLRDISDRKCAEDLLVRQARQSELLFEISRYAGESGSVESVLRKTLEAICELTGWPVGHAFVFSGRDPDELVSSNIWHGSDDPSFEALRQATKAICFTRGVGLPGAILETGAPVWMSDTENEASFLRKGLGYRAAFGFPVNSAGRIIAVLEFFSREAIQPDTDLLLAVRTLGEQVGRALERTRALADLKALNESLEVRVLERTRQLEEAHDALRQAQKMEAIGQLTGGIAHDFNNLLTVIRGSADILRQGKLPDDKQKRYIQAISDTADRAAKLTGQLLAFARRQALKPQVFDAAKRVRSLTEMLRTILGSGITLAVEDRCEACVVEADPGQFEAALVNLVVNSKDAMGPKGHLSIVIDKASAGERGDMVTLTVTDTGRGIDEDQLPRIFEPFFTTKEPGKGTGLGLSQVYGFVKQSDGEVDVHSERGVGTTFTLSFPLADVERISEEPEDIESAAGPADGSRVLVIEDNPEVGEFAVHLLNDLGFNATLVMSGAEGLEMLERAPERFDLVFTDVVMPDMNGVELASLIRERLPDLPIVLTSGYSDVLTNQSNLDFPLLQKPYSAEALLRALKLAGRTGARTVGGSE